MELEKIKKALFNYEYPINEKEFFKAEKFLNKIHAKYGTIDISRLMQLINLEH